MPLDSGRAATYGWAVGVPISGGPMRDSLPAAPEQPSFAAYVAPRPSAESLARSAEHLVLIVEDQPDHRYFYAHVLRWAGYRVEEAPTGRLGLERARAMRPSLVLVDVGVPELDGWELTAALRADPLTCDTPIVICSVYAFPADHERSAAVGCTLHLDKPVSPREVLDVVDRLLGQPPREGPHVG